MSSSSCVRPAGVTTTAINDADLADTLFSHSAKQANQRQGKKQIALFCKASLQQHGDEGNLHIAEMIKHSLASSELYDVTQIELGRELVLLRFFFCSLPCTYVPQSIQCILDYIRLQLQMLYVALSMVFSQGNKRYDFIIVDSVSLALPVLRLLSPKLILFQYQDTHAPRIIEDLFLQGNSRFQYYLEKIWRVFCFVTNIITIICMSIVDKVIVDSYHSQRFLLTMYPYVLTASMRKQKKIFTFCGIKFCRHYPHVLHPYNFQEVTLGQAKLSDPVKKALILNVNHKLLTCMDFSVNTMQEFEFILSVFAKFCMDQRKIMGYHLVLTFIDDSMMQDAMALVQEYKLSDRVTLLADLSAIDRLQLLKQTQILLYPFQRRSFDIILVQSMSLGCPVMASNTGASLEIIGQNGMTGFLLPQDISTWAQKLSDLFVLKGGSQHTISIQDVKTNSKARVRNLFSQIIFTESLHLFMKN